MTSQSSKWKPMQIKESRITIGDSVLIKQDNDNKHKGNCILWCFSETISTGNFVGVSAHFLILLKCDQSDFFLTVHSAKWVKFAWVLPLLETRLEKLLVRGASKLKKLLAPLKSSLSSYFKGVRGQSIKLIMLYFRFRFPQGFVWVCIGWYTHFITPRAVTFSDTF